MHRIRTNRFQTFSNWVKRKITEMNRIFLIMSVTLSLFIINYGCAPEIHDTAELVSPPNGTTVIENPPTFIWTRVEDLDLYCLQVAQDSLFTTLIIDVTCSTDTTYTPGDSLASAIYFWHVRAIRGG